MLRWYGRPTWVNDLVTGALDRAVKFGALFVRENGTTTGKTKGQKPIANMDHGSPTSELDHKPTPNAIEEVQVGKAGTWKCIELWKV